MLATLEEGGAACSVSTKLTIHDMIHSLKNQKPRSKSFSLGEAQLVFMEYHLIVLMLA